MRFFIFTSLKTSAVQGPYRLSDVCIFDGRCLESVCLYNYDNGFISMIISKNKKVQCHSETFGSSVPNWPDIEIECHLQVDQILYNIKCFVVVSVVVMSDRKLTE